MDIELVVAIAENGVIGRAGGLPWRLSTDMKRFKALTMGNPVIMGRKTWETVPRPPLPGRLNIVVTRNPDYAAEGAAVTGSLDEALALSRERAPEAPAIAVIGGGEIYRQVMPLADRLHVTHVLTAVEGDTRFPEIDAGTWAVSHAEDVPVGEKDIYPTRYVVYERRSKT